MKENHENITFPSEYVIKLSQEWKGTMFDPVLKKRSMMETREQNTYLNV